jgi:Holin of 3TMs, for gene-transfer release
MPLASLLIGPVSSLFTTIINKIWGDKMSETEKTQAAQALQLAIMQYDWNAVEKEYQDRDSARQLAKADVDKGNWFTNVLAATVRPFFGYIVMAAFFVSFVTPLIPHAPILVITDIQKEIMLSIIYFYFGGRTVEKGLSIWTGKKGE